MKPIFLLQNENSLIYKFIINLAKPLASGDNITLKVVDEQEVLLGNYTTYFKEGQFAPVREGIHEPDAQFTLKKIFSNRSRKMPMSISLIRKNSIGVG
jgi:hypothetical protein